MSPRAVELVGAPGSGKTTLASWLAGRSTVDGRRVVPAESLVPSARPTIRARLLRRPDRDDGPIAPAWEELAALLDGVQVDGPRAAAGYRAAAAGWFRTTARLVEAVRVAPEELVPVLVEGPVQRSLSVLGPAPDPSLLRRLLDLRPPDVLVVHLDPPEVTLLARAEERLRDGTEPLLHVGRDADAVARFVREDAAALARTVALLAADGVAVLRIAADGTPGPDVATLGARVLHALATGGERSHL